MNTEAIINEMRKIMRNRAKNMDAVDIDTQTLDITKEDIYSELKAIDPDLTNDQVTDAIDKADSEGYVEIITPDIITFKNEFVK